MCILVSTFNGKCTLVCRFNRHAGQLEVHVCLIKVPLCRGVHSGLANCVTISAIQKQPQIVVDGVNA